MTSAYWTALLMVIPLCGWCYVWWKYRTIVLGEFAAGVGAALLILVVVFAISGCVMRGDREILSGYAVTACHTPWWRAEWEERETYTVTDSDGDTHTRTRTVTKSQTHWPKWWMETTIGRFDINEKWFNRLCMTYGSRKELGSRPDFDKGDRYDYFSDIGNKSTTGPDIPVHRASSWSNPFLNSDTIRLGQPVSEEEAREIGLFDYPDTGNPFVSERVMGGAPVSIHRWDQLCAQLGAPKKVNLILINFGDADIAKAVKQRDYWRNGRKNDLVLCYGTGWAYVFGWSRNELVKLELQSLLLENTVRDDLLPSIGQIVEQHFEPFDWDSEKQQAPPRPVPTWIVIIAFILMLGTQIGIGFMFHTNEIDK